MFLSSRHEIFVLLGTFVGGLVLGGVFDAFRIFRINFKSAASLVWLQDIVMWAAMLTVVYVTLFITNDAQLRWYEFAGFAAGLSVYMVALSHFVIGVSTAVISFVKKMFKWIFTVLFFPFCFVIKILRKPVLCVARWIKKHSKCLARRQKQNFLRFSRIFRKI